MESVLKSLPRGEVTLVAMAPPRDVTGSGVKHADTATSKPSPPSDGEGVVNVKVLLLSLYSELMMLFYLHV